MPPWMPFYIGDFLADTMHLGATETGIYIRLLMHCWQHGCIPTNSRQLAMIAHCDTRIWHQYEKIVLRFFEPVTLDQCSTVEASTMQHRRVNTELRRYAEISNKRKASALQMHKIKRANAEQMHTQPQPQPQKKKDRGKPLSTRAVALPVDWQPDRDFASSKGMTDERIDLEVQRFRDHATANNRRQVDWNAAWRNWVTSPFQRTGQPVSVFRPQPTLKEQKQEKWNDLLNQLSEYASRPDDGGEDSEPPLRLLPKNGGQ